MRADRNDGHAAPDGVIQLRDLRREDERVGLRIGRQFDEPAKHRDRGVGLPAVMLRGAEVGERTGASGVIERGGERWCEYPPQRGRGDIELEIPIGALGPRHHVARASGLRAQRRRDEQRQHHKSQSHWVILLSVMSVSRTVPPAGTVTQALCVWNPSRASTRRCRPAVTRILTWGVVPTARPSTSTRAHGLELMDK